MKKESCSACAVQPTDPVGAAVQETQDHFVIFNVPLKVLKMRPFSMQLIFQNIENRLRFYF